MKIILSLVSIFSLAMMLQSCASNGGSSVQTATADTQPVASYVYRAPSAQTVQRVSAYTAAGSIRGGRGGR